MRWWFRKQLLRLKLYASENYFNEAESLVIWYAVCFALGAAFYFALPVELPVWAIVVYLEAVLILLFLYRRREGGFKVLTYALAFMLGLSIAKADAVYRAVNLERDLPEIMYLRGKIKNLDFNSNNRPRLHLTDAEDLDRAYKGDFRISLSYAPDWLKPGKCVELVAKVSKSMTPNPLSNYNFERANFYKGLSASGYSVAPVFEIECAGKSGTFGGIIEHIRRYIQNIVDKNAPPETGAIIKALAIGDRSAVTDTQAENYRTSGLAHFLAISGMHMGIIALLVFFLIRSLLFAAGQGRYDLRKPAAVAALSATFAYFLISGQSVSCMRAFVMTSLVLFGILLNRRSISLRLWAFAVLVVTVITPEAVVSPGFLMSFAAVLGLVSFYEQNGAEIHRRLQAKSLMGKVAAYLAGILLSDLVASLMTLPYSIYYFHQISVYTSLGNLLAGPVIALWVMPALLLFLISLPLGLGGIAVKPLSAGIGVMNGITEWVASLPGAKTGEGVGAMPDWGIFILTVGLLWLCIWQEKWRYWGILGIVIGFLAVCFSPSPDFVFDTDGTTYAYKDKDGKLVSSRFHKNRFLVKMWTGEKKTVKKDKAVEEADGVVCADETCVYRGRIEFTKGKIRFDGKDIPLKSGGYINLKTGIFYYKPETSRLWNAL